MPRRDSELSLAYPGDTDEQKPGFPILRALGVCLFLVLALAGCRKEVSQQRSNFDSLPCWVRHPVKGDVIGGVGMVRADTHRADEALKWGKRKAAANLAAYCDAGKEAIEEVEDLGVDSGERTQFGECRLGFAQRIRHGAHMYVYAFAGESPSEQWLRQTDCDSGCSPSACEPEWLCQPMGKNRAGFVGVSERASSKSRQYQLAVANALEQMALIYGVTVDAEYFQAKGVSGSGSAKMVRRESNTLQVPGEGGGEHPTPRPVIAESCRSGERLFVRVLDYSLPPLHQAPPEKWLSTPDLDQRVGVIGSAGPTAGGRLSDQFRLAMKRGLVQLAQAKEIDVRGTTYVRRSRSRRFVLDIQHQSTHTTIQGEVAGVYFRKEPLGLRLFLWIREPAASSGADRQKPQALAEIRLSMLISARPPRMVQLKSPSKDGDHGTASSRHIPPN